MIKFGKGNILESKSDALVVPVNCIGVMDKGLALDFKLKYPSMFTQYKERCSNNELSLGKIDWCITDNTEGNRMIILFPTKDSWREKSDPIDIVNGLRDFTKYVKSGDLNIKSVAFPKLGCGEGGLDWNSVKIIMEFYLNDLDLDIYIHE